MLRLRWVTGHHLAAWAAVALTAALSVTVTPAVAAPPAPALAATPATSPAALGLLVKLREANARPQALGAPVNKQLDAERAQRLGKLLTELRMQTKAVKPNGRAAQHLDFGRVLTADEAERLSQQLRARPEVEWVVPNVREQRLQVVEPSDPRFRPSGPDVGQWWLYPAGGSSSNAVRDRLRGVPAIQTAWSQHRGDVKTPAAPRTPNWPAACCPATTS
jgi:hypothetical protein